MAKNDYNYEIEKLLAQYGGEADKGITRICGNCHLYNADLWTCEHAENAEDASIYEENKTGCYYHRTNEENERLKLLVKQRQDESNRLRLEEQRRNGTGVCEGCPYREMYAMLEYWLQEAVKSMNHHIGRWVRAGLEKESLLSEVRTKTAIENIRKTKNLLKEIRKGGMK